MQVLVCFFIVLTTFSLGMTDTVAIIGAGPSGIVAAKSALEVGLQPTVLEKNEDIGGIWNPTQGATWKTLKTNLSKFSCMFSDFPWKSSVGGFPTAPDMHDYLQGYIDHFALRPFINLNTEVLKVRLNESNQKWIVTYNRKGDIVEEEFTYVIIATGFFSKPIFPPVDMTKFSGTVIHSKEYKNLEIPTDKEVVVVGGSFTGVEIAAEVPNFANKTSHISIKKNLILPRFLVDDLGRKLPLDLIFYKRILSASSIQDMNQETKHYFALLNEQGKISKELAIHPEEYISDPFVVICDTYIDQVKKDKIDIYTSRVVQMEEKLVKLEDGTQINADIVIFCTGFSPYIPFFEENILKDIEFDAKNQFQPFVLYEGVFHPKLPNMAFVGMYRDPYFGIMELQARWACMAFANKEEYYPNIQELEEGIAKERSIRELNPAPQFPHGDCLTFADTLAKKIHVLPNIMGIDFAMIPARFRLQGPHSNPEMALQILMDYQRFILGAQ